MDETPTRNMYTIVLEPFGYGTLDDCKAKAEEIYNKWKADGAKLEDFKALVRQYSTDDVSVFADGLYSNIKKGDMIDELDAWLFGKDTEVGAHTFMSTKYGCHIVYYSGDGEPAWKAPVIDQIKESKVSSVIYSYTEKYPVTQVEGNMKYVKAN
jgi:parvulin-like peptidyl-prolyl isomerase